MTRGTTPGCAASWSRSSSAGDSTHVRHGCQRSADTAFGATATRAAMHLTDATSGPPSSGRRSAASSSSSTSCREHRAGLGVVPPRPVVAEPDRAARGRVGGDRQQRVARAGRAVRDRDRLAEHVEQLRRGPTAGGQAEAARGATGARSAEAVERSAPCVEAVSTWSGEAHRRGACRDLRPARRVTVTARRSAPWAVAFSAPSVLTRAAGPRQPSPGGSDDY
jgi:hypothetical protein